MLLENKEAKIGLRGVDGYETLKVIDLIYTSSKKGIKIMNENVEG